MYNPLVSIVIPVYNGSNYLSQAIDCALEQTYKNLEVIVVNDGSNDNGATEKVALSYGDKIKYYSKENGGASSALNYGIKKMSGEWLSWLSHDDLYKPTKIESAIKQIINNKLDVNNTIVSCSVMQIDKHGNEIPRYSKKINKFYNSKEMFERLLLSGNLGGCALLIPKKLIDKTNGFDETYTYIPDLDMWTQFTLIDTNFYVYDEVLQMNRRHSEQVTALYPELYPKELNRWSNKLFEDLLKSNKSDWYFNILLRFCSTIQNEDMSKKIIEYLSSNGDYTIKDKVDISAYKAKTQIRNLMAGCYKKLINGRVTK